MSSCQLQITFERENRTFTGGETIRGQVVIRTSTVLDCRSFKIERFWATHGRGNKDRGKISEQIFHTGRFPAGHTQAFPFRFEAPAFPFTYRGRYADNLLRAIDWAMEVDPLLRPQSVAQFRAALTADTTPEPEAPRSAFGWLTDAFLGKG